jgi:4-amino-4-deoxy-L-arabinose transferase-like glycosyltransferase
MLAWLRRTKGTLICVAFAAIARAACVAATWDDPVFRVPYLDSAFYHTWARSLAAGEGDFRGPYFLAPLYPHVLAWLYRAFGSEVAVARLFQSALGVFDVAAVVALGRLVGGPVAAYAAAALFALFGCLVFYEGLLVLDPLLLSLLLWASVVLVLPRRQSWAHAALLGALLGLATLARATALLAAPVVAAVLARDARRWRNLLACAAVWGAVVAPVVWRNQRLGGGFVLTTNGGVNFYAGNGPGANGRFRQPPELAFFTSAEVVPADAGLPTAVAARPLTVEAVAGSADAADSGAWLGRSWAWIRANPGEFALLWLRKLGLALQGREIAQIESFAFHRDRVPALRFFFVDWSWLLPLAALGFWSCRRRPGSRALLACAAAALMPCVVFFAAARYRLAAAPLAAVFAGCGIAALLAQVRAREWGRLGVTLVVLAAFAALTRVGAKPPRAAPGWENAQMAERVYALGDLDAAIRYQSEAVRWLPARPEVRFNLALYLDERGDRDQALAELRALLQQHPDFAPARELWRELGGGAPPPSP